MRRLSAYKCPHLRCLEFSVYELMRYETFLVVHEVVFRDFPESLGTGIKSMVSFIVVSVSRLFFLSDKHLPKHAFRYVFLSQFMFGEFVIYFRFFCYVILRYTLSSIIVYARTIPRGRHFSQFRKSLKEVE